MNSALSIILYVAIAAVVLFVIIRVGPDLFNVVSNLFEQWRVNSGERMRRILGRVDNSTLAGCALLIALAVVAVIVLLLIFGLGILSGPYHAVADTVTSVLRLLKLAGRLPPK